MKELQQSSVDEKLFEFLCVTAAAAALLPEYIAPFFTLGGFCVFKYCFGKTERKVRMGNTAKYFLLFMCFSFLSVIWSGTRIYSGAVSLLWMGMLLGAFYTANICTDRERIEKLIKCLSVGGGAVGAIGSAEYALLLMRVKVPNPLWSVFDVIIYRILPFSITDTANVWEASRASSTFDNPLICATYLLLILPVAVYGFSVSSGKEKALYGVSALCMFGGILGTSSRTPALAALAAVGLFAVLNVKNIKKLLPVAGGLIVGCGAFGAIMLRRYMLRANDFQKSTSNRIKMWKACWELIKKKPVLGYGAGCEGTSQGMLEYGIKKPHAHSLYIEMTTELGFVGLIFLLAVFALVAYDIFKLIKCGGYYGRLGKMFLCVAVAFAIGSLTEFTMQTPKELQYFMIILGLLEAVKRNYSVSTELYS